MGPRAPAARAFPLTRASRQRRREAARVPSPALCAARGCDCSPAANTHRIPGVPGLHFVPKLPVVFMCCSVFIDNQEMKSVMRHSRAPRVHSTNKPLSNS